MSLTDDLYRDIILEHFKNPRNAGRLEKPTLTSHGANPFCGDEMELTLEIRGGAIQEIRVESKGCSISQASASMMSEAVKGRRLEEAEELAKRFKATMLHDAPLELSAETEDLQALEGVKKYPVRIKCAILSWNTLLEGITAHRTGKPEANHVETEEGEHEAAPTQGASDNLRAGAPTPSGIAHSSTREEISAPPTGTGHSGTREEEVRAELRKVMDPELNMNVVDLGLVYGINVEQDRVKVTYTLTSPGCPLGPVIKGQMQSALGKLPWVKEIQSDLVWQPQWDPKTMASEEVKAELGIW